MAGGGGLPSSPAHGRPPSPKYGWEARKRILPWDVGILADAVDPHVGRQPVARQATGHKISLTPRRCRVGVLASLGVGEAAVVGPARPTAIIVVTSPVFGNTELDGHGLKRLNARN